MGTVHPLFPGQSERIQRALVTIIRLTKELEDMREKLVSQWPAHEQWVDIAITRRALALTRYSDFLKKGNEVAAYEELHSLRSVLYGTLQELQRVAASTG